MILRRMQSLLVRLYDAHVEHDPQEFLISDRRELAKIIGPEADDVSDEHVFIIEDQEGVRVGLFIDREVLERLSHNDPMDALREENLQDFCTALEGVSHFHYLLWSLNRGRAVSLLELELKAEVDKYASALMLLTRQSGGEFPRMLHSAMFDRVKFVPNLERAVRQRYEEANRRRDCDLMLVQGTPQDDEPPEGRRAVRGVLFALRSTSNVQRTTTALNVGR